MSKKVAAIMPQSDRQIEKAIEESAEKDVWMKIVELEQKVDDNHAGIGACLETFAVELKEVKKRIEALESRQTFRMVHFCGVKDCGHAQSVKIDLDEMKRLRDLSVGVPRFWKCGVCNEKNEYLAPAFYLKEAEKRMKGDE